MCSGGDLESGDWAYRCGHEEHVGLPTLLWSVREGPTGHRQEVPTQSHRMARLPGRRAGDDPPSGDSASSVRRQARQTPDRAVHRQPNAEGTQEGQSPGADHVVHPSGGGAQGARSGGTPFTVLSVGINMLPIDPTGPMPRDLPKFLDTDRAEQFFHGNWTWFAMTALVALLAPWVEELFFPGPAAATNASSLRSGCTTSSTGPSSRPTTSTSRGACQPPCSTASSPRPTPRGASKASGSGSSPTPSPASPSSASCSTS